GARAPSARPSGGCGQTGLECRTRSFGHFNSWDTGGHSHRLAEQLAADQHAPDFAGARADLVQLGVAPQATQRVLVDVAVAAKNLAAVAGHAGGSFGAP